MFNFRKFVVFVSMIIFLVSIETCPLYFFTENKHFILRLINHWKSTINTVPNIESVSFWIIWKLYLRKSECWSILTFTPRYFDESAHVAAMTSVIVHPDILGEFCKGWIHLYLISWGGGALLTAPLKPFKHHNSIMVPKNFMFNTWVIFNILGNLCSCWVI